jgi:hypothetical protein
MGLTKRQPSRSVESRFIATAWGPEVRTAFAVTSGCSRHQNYTSYTSGDIPPKPLIPLDSGNPMSVFKTLSENAHRQRLKTLGLAKRIAD